MTLKTIEAAPTCIHHWRLPSNISMKDGWEEKCLKCGTYRTIAQQPEKTPSNWRGQGGPPQHTPEKPDPKPTRRTKPIMDTPEYQEDRQGIHHDEHSDEYPAERQAEQHATALQEAGSPDQDDTGPDPEAQDTDRGRDIDRAQDMDHSQEDTSQHQPEVKAPSGQDLLKQLADRGWTKHQIAKHPTINRSFSLIDNWASGRTPVPSKHIPTLSNLVASGEPAPKQAVTDQAPERTTQAPSTAPAANNGHKPDTHIPSENDTHADVGPGTGTDASADTNANQENASDPNPWNDPALTKMIEEQDAMDLTRTLLTKAVQARKDYLMATRPAEANDGS